MLRLLKNDVVTSVAKTQVLIKKLEMDWYIRNYGTLSGTSSMLAGFAFGQVARNIPYDKNWGLSMAYIITSVTSLGIHLLIVLITTLCFLWGPGLALRGDQGAFSVERAVKGLRQSQKHVYILFVAGTLIFLVSYILQIILFAHAFLGFFFTVLVGSFFIMMLYYWRKVVSNLRIDTAAVDGTMGAFQHYNLVPDIDVATSNATGVIRPAVLEHGDDDLANAEEDVNYDEFSDDDVMINTIDDLTLGAFSAVFPMDTRRNKERKYQQEAAERAIQEGLNNYERMEQFRSSSPQRHLLSPQQQQQGVSFAPQTPPHPNAFMTHASGGAVPMNVQFLSPQQQNYSNQQTTGGPAFIPAFVQFSPQQHQQQQGPQFGANQNGQP
eukprot:GDKK01004324.1.p1 GENE.GDKK01004324.1~~GDKK01004324.1.p1  ORF type:complete len:381 (-),score=92.23 GDKK01004324.1:243-1385(-)